MPFVIISYIKGEENLAEIFTTEDSERNMTFMSKGDAVVFAKDNCAHSFKVVEL